MNSDFSTNSEWERSERPKKLRSRNAAALRLPNFTDLHATTDGDCEEVSTPDNIRVLVRIRPKNDREKKDKDSRTVIKALDPHTLMFDPKQDPVEFFFHGVRQKVYDYKTRPNKNLRFAFDQVFSPSQSNVEIFDNALKPLINHVIRGFNCSVFAYGATGSGKTYTMLGSSGNPGLTFLMAKELSKRIKEMANEYESEIVVSYLEVYNETIRDLLYPSGQLSIREDGLNGVNVPNLTLHKIKDTSDLLRMLSHGNKARTQHPTDHNAESSRSHAVFQIFVSLRKRITHLSLNYKMAKAKLVMVDLAGSERGSTNNSDNQRCREGGSINKSLLALGNCINALADGKKHIPYRDSKLTRLLKDSLGGNCKTVMIATVAPTALNFDDTYNTLKYSDRAKEIRVSLKKNVSVEQPDYSHYGKMIGDLQSEINQLKLVLEAEREASNSLQHEQQTKRTATRRPPLDSGYTRPNITLPPVIHDPAALENFIQLLGQKKKLEEAHVDASINARESEWRLMWQKWRIDSVSALSRRDNEDQELRLLDELKSEYKNLRAEHERCQEKVGLARRLVDFNDKEIDLIQKTFPDFSEQDDPFLTVTLREFLNYKTLEREVRTHKCIENFHQQMCSGMLDELLRTEIILSDNLKFTKYLHEMLEKHGIPVSPRRHPALVSRIYGGKKLIYGVSKERKKDVHPWEESLEKMIQLMKSPIVEYESPATAGRPYILDGSNSGSHHELPLLNASHTSCISNLGTAQHRDFGNSGDIFGVGQSSSSDSESERETFLRSGGDADYGHDGQFYVEAENQEAPIRECKVNTPSIEYESSRSSSTTSNILPKYCLPQKEIVPSTDYFGQIPERLSGKCSKSKQLRPAPSQGLFPEKRRSHPSSYERKLEREQLETLDRKPIPLVERKEQRSDYVTKANYSGSFDRGKQQQVQSPEKKAEVPFKDPKTQKAPLYPTDAEAQPLFQMNSSPRSQKSGIGKPKIKKSSSRKEKQKKSSASQDQVSLRHDPLSHAPESKSNVNGPAILPQVVPKKRQKSTTKAPGSKSRKLQPSAVALSTALSPRVKPLLEILHSVKKATPRKSKIVSDSEILKSSSRTVPSQHRQSPRKWKPEFTSTQMFAREPPVPGVPAVPASKTTKRETPLATLGSVGSKQQPVAAVPKLQQQPPKATLDKAVVPRQEQPSATVPKLAHSSKLPSISRRHNKMEKGAAVKKEDEKEIFSKSKDLENIRKQKIQETPVPPCKQDSEEYFWTNGMYNLPSPPETYASSEGEFTQADLNSRFNFSEEGKELMERQTDSHHFQSRDHDSPEFFQLPSPVNHTEPSHFSPPRSSNWETADDTEPPYISPRISKYRAGVTTWPDKPHHHFQPLQNESLLDTRWRPKNNPGLDYHVGGRGDARFEDDGFDIQCLEVEEGPGDHEDLIVKPPPGYEQPSERSYFTRLLSYPHDFSSF